MTSSPEATRGSGLLLALCGGAWGSALLFISEALESFDPIVIALARNVITAAGLMAWLWFVGPRVPREIVRDLGRRPGLAVASGLAGFAAPMLLVTYAAERLPTGLVAVMLASSPLMVALVALRLAPGDGVGLRGTLGLLVGLLGVGLAMGGEGLSAPGRLAALLLPLGAAAMTALYPMVMRRGYAGVPPIAIVAHATTGAAVVSLFLLPFAELPSQIGWRAVGAVLVLGVVCTAVPFAMHAALVGRIGSVRAGTANYFIPVTGVLLGVVVLGEQLRATALLGLVLILGGVWVAARRRAPITPLLPATSAP